MSFIPPNSPPFTFPPTDVDAPANSGNIGGTASNTTAPPLTPQAPIASGATTVATTGPNATAYQGGLATTAQVNKFFGIISPTPGSGT